MLGRSFFPVIEAGFTPSLAVDGTLAITSKYKIPQSWIKKAVLITPVSGTKGYSTITFAGTYAVGDFIRVTFTARRGGQEYRKSFTHTVVSGATSVTNIADYFDALIDAEILAGASDIYASADNVAGVLTVTQAGDDKKSLKAYVYTDSASGTVAAIDTATTYSEGQPSDLVDAGIPSGSITLASYDTVKLQVEAEVSSSQIIEQQAKDAKEVYVYLTPGKGAILRDIVNNTTVTQNIGVAATGFSAVETGDSVNHVTTITVNTTFPAIAGGADLAVGKLAYTFPAGAINIKATKINIALTAVDGNIDADTPDLGIGTVIASGAVAVLGGTATFENILTGQTMNNCTGTAEVKTLATSLVIETADAHTVYLNVADGWAAGGEAALPVTGTITIEWSFMG